MARMLNLKKKMLEKNITSKSIAQLLGVTEKTFTCKINGRSDFTWGQLCKIHNTFFPEVPKDELFELFDREQSQNTA